ncbi:MAG: ABC transporter permease subunit [Rhodospirillales bacterium]|nr:ABC transporter permease subunit [Rhodospirillales bacterium]
MLVWSRSGRALAWLFGGTLIAVVYGLPLAMIALASFAGQWNSALPSHFTWLHYASAVRGDSAAMLRASLLTGAAASAVALAAGTWAALALRRVAGPSRRLLDLVFFIPSAVPSVSVGLGLLVAFSRPPVLLNGTVAIVLVAHLVLVSAFAYGNVAAGLARLGHDIEQMAASLGARPAYTLRRVTLPLLTPYLLAAFSLSFALSMGELGATIMVYPPGWVTMPVGIFALTDRGDIFHGAAVTILLAAATLVVLAGLSALPAKAAARR